MAECMQGPMHMRLLPAVMAMRTNQCCAAVQAELFRAPAFARIGFDGAGERRTCDNICCSSQFPTHAACLSA